MTMRVFFRDGAIFIDRLQPVPHRSLIAWADGDNVSIQTKNGILIFEGSFSQIADADGGAFADAPSTIVYLQGQFAMREPIGEVFGARVIAFEAIPVGMPVAISRADGKLRTARADTYTLAFVAGLLTEPVAAGFPVQPRRGAITLPNASLTPGLPYFLAGAGGIADRPPSAACVTRIGIAASPTTLVVDPTDPVLL